MSVDAKPAALGPIGEDHVAKLHMKGFILQLFEAAPDGLWDYEVMERVLDEYGHEGRYWRGEVRVTLTDLYSSAIIEEIEDGLDDGRYFGKGRVLVKFRLTPNGRRRMADTGLLARPTT